MKRFEGILMIVFVLLLLLATSQSESDVPVLTMQCALKHNFDFKLCTDCRPENSCILADLRVDENSSATYEVNRTQIHEFKCLIFVDSYIVKIPSNIFISAKSKISHLYANNVSINELSRNSFLIANQLESVDLSWNDLQELHETAFYDASNLITLNLSHNDISDILSNVFEKLDNLQNLDLSYNQITSIPFDIFQPLNNLQSLDMRFNRLQLKFGMFPESLRSLDLSFNNLEIQQKFKIFALLGHLEVLLLHGNRIESIHPSIFESGNVKFLGLSENLFACNTLADIILSMKTHSILPVVENDVRFTSNIYGIRCME